MGNTKDMKQMLVELASPKRNNYYYGKMMDVRHFDMEQQYGNHKRWLNNRLTLGEGVLCGLEVEVEEDGKNLSISTGAAIDALGREIIVHVRTRIDPWILTDKCRDAASELSRMENHVVHICLAYNECLTDHEPVLVAGCGSQEECAPGTVIETFKVIVKEGLPDKPTGIYPKCCDVLKWPTESTDSPEGVTPGPLSVISNIPVGGRPVATAVSMTGRRALVIDEQAPVVHIIDIPKRMVKKSIPIPGFSLRDVTFAPDGGPAFVTHSIGVAIIDADSPSPRVVRNILIGKNYGILAASNKGTRLFAFDKQTGKIDIINVNESKLEGTIDIQDTPKKMEVSSDSQSLFIIAEKSDKLYRYDLIGKKLHTLPAGDSSYPAVSLSRRPLDGESKPVITLKNGEVLFTDRESGVVTIVGGQDKRQTLCERLSKPCPPCPGDACVVLAAVELGFDTISQTHKIIGIDQCSYRKKIYSNQVLMDLILCLADRLDECCKQEPVPEPEPETLRVKSIELLNDANEILATVRQFPPHLVFNELPPRIRVTFTKKVAPDTIKTFESNSAGDKEVSFLVLYPVPPEPIRCFAVPGEIMVETDPHTILWKVHPSWRRDEKHTFTIALIGDEGGPIFPNIGKFIPIRSDSGELLDGDPPVNSLPSGNSVAGGTLNFFLTVVGSE